MSRYREKPRTVEAAQYTGDNATNIMWWLDQRANPPAVRVVGNGLDIRGDNYELYAVPGDWIVSNAYGGYHLWPNDTFHKRYELAEGSP